MYNNPAENPACIKCLLLIIILFMLGGWVNDRHCSTEWCKFAIYIFFKNLFYLEKWTFKISWYEGGKRVKVQPQISHMFKHPNMCPNTYLGNT